MDPAAGFSIDGLLYGDPMLLDVDAFVDSPCLFDGCEMFLLGLVRKPGMAFTCRHDFGDSWLDLVDIEPRVAVDLMPKFATCTVAAAGKEHIMT